jgi:hypothetical protein
VIRLVSGSSLKQDAVYLALSYRWGIKKDFALQCKNLSIYKQEIPSTQIPPVIRDAIEVTRSLGFRYLWVDSMCIIQDDPEDWARESATMSKIYGSAVCTIAAANSGSDDTGFFSSRNPYRIRPCRIPNPFNTNSKYSFYVRSQYLNKIHMREIRDSDWFNRGWVFQERILSSRLLLFTSTQVLWACQELQAAETWPCGKTGANYIDRFDSFAAEKARFMELMDPWDGVNNSHDAWWSFIREYVSLQLTIASDRLIALQGIATVIESFTGQKYCSGFWLNESFANSLLWKVPEDAKVRPKEYRAPSWSWASVEGMVTPHEILEDFTTVVGIVEHLCIGEDDLSTESPRVREALRLTGSLIPAMLLTTSCFKEAKLIRTEAAAKWLDAVKIVGGRAAYSHFILTITRSWNE